MGDKEAVVEGKAAVEIDYSTYSMEQLLEAIGKAYQLKDMKLMGSLSKLYTKKEAAVETDKREALQKELLTKTLDVKAAFDKLAVELAESGNFDGADGIWYSWDWGTPLKDAQCRITRKTAAATRTPGEGSSAGKSSYVANPIKTEVMLAEVGEQVWIKEAIKVTIDKADQQLPAGMTFNEAWKLSTNGGWRNKVRQALLLKTNRI